MSNSSNNDDDAEDSDLEEERTRNRQQGDRLFALYSRLNEPSIGVEERASRVLSYSHSDPRAPGSSGTAITGGAVGEEHLERQSPA